MSQVVLSEDLEDQNEALQLPLLPEQPTDMHPQKQPANPPTGSEATAVVCCQGCGRRYHHGCIAAATRLRPDGQEPWFCRAACQAVSKGLAELAGKGLMRCTPQLFEVPLAWQVIAGTAVSNPEACSGFAPAYKDEVRKVLRGVLTACRHLLAESCSPMAEASSGKDLLPEMLRGYTKASGLKHGSDDLSGFHTALLWADNSVVAVGLLRTLGSDVAEIPVLTCRPELQGHGLAQLLLRHVEAALIRLGVRTVLMPAILQKSEVASPENDNAAFWGRKVGYKPGRKEEMRGLANLPFLMYPGSRLLSKALSANALPKVNVPVAGQTFDRLRMQEDPGPFAKGKILQPVH